MAIVGRPNVGKSALFNRLMGERRAIVEDLPGTTRDRLYGDVEWRGRTFSVVDTGGLDPGLPRDRRSSRLARPRAPRGGRVGAGDEPKGDVIGEAVRAQADAAIEEADLVLFVVDAQSGLLSIDADVADVLRRSGKPVLLVASKAESWRGEAQAHEFHRLGLGAPLAVSALHGIGTGDLLDAVLAALPEPREPAIAADARIAIVGRPNVGKSSLLNAIVGSERAVVGPLPGTTRDPVDTLMEREGRRLLFVDTAGLRRRGRIEPGIEAHATLRTVRAVDRSDVAILLIDATEGITAQDLHVAGYVLEAYKGLVVGVNKWDVVERGEAAAAAFRQELRRALRFAPWAPQLFVSAKTGRNLAAVVDAAVAAADARRKRVPAADLRRFLVEAVGRRPPPAGSTGAQPRFTHVLQSEGEGEPVFAFFVSRPDAVHFTYKRYLENELRKRFGFEGTPVRLVFRGGEARG